MKKSACIPLILLSIAIALSGCGQKQPAKTSVFEQGNEILTYQKIDPKKTQLIVSRTGNIPVEQLCAAFEKANPDIQVIFLDITGGNSAYAPLNDYVANGDVPDVLISASGFFSEDMSISHFENLSDNQVVANFEAAALQRTAMNANVYWLPGPSDISAMMYNKTLFAQYGWEVPSSFDEFVALCDRIRADTNGEIQPWNPNAKYDNELITAIQAMTYEEVLGGLENRAWYNDFLDGKANAVGHLEPYTDALQTLIEHGILLPEHFTYSATTRGKEFAAGKIAMLNGSIFNADNNEYEYGFMPFPSTTGSIGYLCDSYSCYVGVPVKEHTEKEKVAIQRFLAFFSSAEGQKAYISTSLKVSNVKGVTLNPIDELAALQPAVSAGHMFGRVNFWNDKTQTSILYLHDFAIKMTLEGMTGAQCLAEVDARRASQPPVSSSSAAAPAQTPAPLANVKENMTMLETSFLIADMYREAASAEIGLITHGEAYRGNLMRLFAGDINAGIVSVLKPRSFANDATLVKLSMTGQQIMNALNNPVGNDRTADCVYAFSGLKCEIAPWNELGKKYLSVKLADGSALDMAKRYTVAAWAGTVADEYIAETLQTYEGTWEKWMTAKLQKDGVITPAKDGRCKLIWN